MTQDTESTSDILALVFRDLPNFRGSVDEGVDTANFLVDLGRTYDGFLNSYQQQALAAICRALSVTRKVKAVYDLQWKRPLTSKILAPQYWPVMIAVLSGRFGSRNVSEDDAKGEELKRLNAALTALDISYDLGDVPHLSQLSAYLNRRLQDTLS